MGEQYDYGNTRNMATLIVQILQGWRGHKWHDPLMGPQEHRSVDAALCAKYFNHAEKELLAWINKDRNTPELALNEQMQGLIYPIKKLIGISGCPESKRFTWDFYEPELHGHLSDLSNGVRSTVNKDGLWVTDGSNVGEEEEEHMAIGGVGSPEVPADFLISQGPEAYSFMEDSEDELDAEEAEEFYPEYFAEAETWIPGKGKPWALLIFLVCLIDTEIKSQTIWIIPFFTSTFQSQEKKIRLQFDHTKLKVFLL